MSNHSLVGAIVHRKPQEDESLHSWIKAVLGYHIPRVAVTAGMQAPFELISDTFFQRTRRALVLASRGSGKCHIGTDRVLLPMGHAPQICSLTSRSNVIGFDEHALSFSVTKGLPVKSFGVQEVLEIELRTGRKITVTLNHPLFQVDGWRKALTLKAGDLIATMRFWNVKGKPLPDGDAFLLGMFIGDGYVPQRTLSIADLQLLNKVRDVLNSRGWRLVYKEQYDWIVRSQTPYSREVGDWLYSNIPEHSVSQNKRVPDAIWLAGRDDVASFLGAYFDCDGHLDGKQTAEYYSVSRELLEDVQLLLLRFGIVATLARKKGHYKGKRYLSWRLRVSGAELFSFLMQIPLYGQKRHTANTMIGTLQKKTRNTNHDVVPLEVVKLLKKTRYWHERRGVRIGMTNRKYGISRHILRKAAQNEQNEELLSLINAPIYWDRITRITRRHAEVFNVEVPDLHALVVNGIVSHNTHNLAVSTLLRSHFEPGVTTGYYAAVEAQGEWGFDYLKDMAGQDHLASFVSRNVQDRIEWGNGSWARSGGGHTKRGITAFRCNRLVIDEVDLWDPSNYETANYMVTGTHEHLPERLVASTAYNAYGMMSTLLAESVRRDFTVYRWDIFTVMERCERCLKHKCPLYQWIHPRSGKREYLCKGRGLRSDGFLPREVVVDEFLSTDSETFLVQKLLASPERKSLIYPTFSMDVHASEAPPPEALRYGNIGIGIDWGFDHPLVFTVFAQLPSGRIWGIEERAERFATPARELEMAQELQREYRNVVFFAGKDQPKSIAQLVEAGLTVVPNLVEGREDGHRYVRRLLDRNLGPLLHLDPKRMPVTAHQMGTLHRDEKGKEALKNNDYADSARYALASNQEMGGTFVAGGAGIY